MSRLRDGAGRAAMGNRPDRAVIDIGSNTVRLVVYSGSRRAPGIWLNEKVTAKPVSYTHLTLPTNREV